MRFASLLFWTLLSFVALISAAKAGDGLSAASPFLNFDEVDTKANTPGIYYFSIKGVAFSTYVNSNKELLIANDYASTSSASLPQGTAVTNTARGILSAAVLAKFTNVLSLRMITSGGLINSTTSAIALTSRIPIYQTLHLGTADAGTVQGWTGTGATYMNSTGACNTAYGTTLDLNVFHACGDPNSFIWVPGQFYRQSWGLGAAAAGMNFSLYVKAGVVPIPSLQVVKTANSILNVAKGQVVTYTYTITNNGTQAITNVGISDAHNGYGTSPVPNIETATLTDNGTLGNSPNASTSNGKWDTLAAGDVLTVTANYTVVQGDIDNRQ